MQKCENLNGSADMFFSVLQIYEGTPIQERYIQKCTLMSKRLLP